MILTLALDRRRANSKRLLRPPRRQRKSERKMAWMHAFDTDAPASSPYDRFKDSLRVVGHCASHGIHTARPNQMLQDAARNLVVAFKSCCRLKIRPVYTPSHIYNTVPLYIHCAPIYDTVPLYIYTVPLYITLCPRKQHCVLIYIHCAPMYITVPPYVTLSPYI